VKAEATMDDIDLASIEKSEIIKDQNSTSFGSGLGGVIQLFFLETCLWNLLENQRHLEVLVVAAATFSGIQ
jgi:hypothetical protein